jgi:hypothetical protein
VLHLVSFTGTLSEFVRGNLTVEEIANATIHFGCHVCHVFPLEAPANYPNRDSVDLADLVPMELSWHNDKFGCERASRYDATEIPQADVAPELLKMFREFQGAVQQARDADRCSWQTGNQFATLYKLPLEDEVFFQGRRGTVESFSTAEERARCRTCHGRDKTMITLDEGGSPVCRGGE